MRSFSCVCVGFLGVIQFSPTVQRHEGQLATLTCSYVRMCVLMVVSSVTGWWSALGVPCLSPIIIWDWFQLLCGLLRLGHKSLECCTAHTTRTQHHTSDSCAVRVVFWQTLQHRFSNTCKKIDFSSFLKICRAINSRKWQQINGVCLPHVQCRLQMYCKQLLKLKDWVKYGRKCQQFTTWRVFQVYNANMLPTQKPI